MTNQFARRNVHDADFNLLIGELYNIRKKIQGGTGTNQYEQSGQNVHSAKTAETLAKELSYYRGKILLMRKDPRGGNIANRQNVGLTAQKIADERGVTERTIQRDEDFSNGVHIGMPRQNVEASSTSKILAEVLRWVGA